MDKDFIRKFIDNKLEPKDIAAALCVAIVASLPKIFKTTKILVDRHGQRSRIYDHSINQYIYLRRPMNGRESTKYIELRESGYSVRDAVDMIGLRRRYRRFYDL